MKTNEAIISFSQSEKIKAGLIWVSQTLEILGGLSEGERKGGERVVHAIINMIINEIGLARNVAGIEGWEGIESLLDQAIVMVNSGVGHEANIHISQALSKVTNVGQKSMMFLREEELI